MFCIVFILFVGLSFGWSGHDAITYYIIQDYLGLLDDKVPITEYSYGMMESRIYNENPYRSIYEDYCGKMAAPPEDERLFSPVYPNPEPKDNTVPAWQILTVYSYEPDMGMDKELELSSYQFLTGGSQGWRHMEFRILFFKLGKVTDSVEYFTELAKKAEEKGDDYWFYRFMARALHYLEDSGMPYHTFPAPFVELLKLPFNYNKWLTIFSNYHFTFDNYAGYLLWEEYEPLVNAIKVADPHKINDPKKAASELRKKARNKLNEVYYEMKKLMKNDLHRETVFLPDKEYFHEFRETNNTKKLDKLTIELLKQVASYTKGYLEYMLIKEG
ncbi:MAG: phospholipase [Kosmotoga sp.]|nr:MAG: phospholipase [Kosmotoga sp.]